MRAPLTRRTTPHSAARHGEINLFARRCQTDISLVRHRVDSSGHCQHLNLFVELGQTTLKATPAVNAEFAVGV